MKFLVVVLYKQPGHLLNKNLTENNRNTKVEFWHKQVNIDLFRIDDRCCSSVVFSEQKAAELLKSSNCEDLQTY